MLLSEQCPGSNYHRGNEAVSLRIGDGGCERGRGGGGGREGWWSIQLLITEEMELTQEHIFLQNNCRFGESHTLEC